MEPFSEEILRLQAQVKYQKNKRMVAQRSARANAEGIKALKATIQSLTEERDGLKELLDREAKMALRLQSTVDTLRAALKELHGCVIGSDCYKHLPDAVVKHARTALSTTKDRACSICTDPTPHRHVGDALVSTEDRSEPE